MDRRNARPNGADGRRILEPTAVDDTEPRKSVGTSRTVTVTNSQRVVTRRSVAGAANSLNYEVDPWEISPKTDYTYSRTRSYLKQPPNDNYISPNMSRQGLRRSVTPHQMHDYAAGKNEYVAAASSDQNSTVTRSLVVEGSSYEESGSSAGVGRGDGGVDTYMTLRSRTLMTQQEAGNWRADGTFAMRNMHGMDLEEEEDGMDVEVSDTESTRDLRPIVVGRPSLYDRFSSFIVTIVQVSWSFVTLLPRKAFSTVSTFATGMSKSNMSNNTHQITKRARSTTSTSRAKSTSNTSTHFVSGSKWHTLKTVVGFLFYKLPVGLGSWIVYGIISAGRLTRGSVATMWHSFETFLKSTFTKTTRVTDAALLSRTSGLRRRCGCLCLVLFFILLPLLFGLLYATSCQREDVAIVVSSVRDRFSAFFFPLLFAAKEKETIDTTKPTVIVNTGGAGTAGGDQGDADDDKISLLAIADMESRMRDLFLVLANDHRTMAQAEQDRTLSAFRSHLDRLVKMIVQRELQLQRITIKVAADDGRAILMAEQQKQMAALLAMRNSLDDLAEQVGSLAEELKVLKAGMSVERAQARPETERSDSVQLEQLTLLQGKYDELVAKMAKWPTQDQTTNLIRTKIQEYFVQVMGAGGSGGAAAGDDETGAEAGVHPFERWLNEQYLNHEDLDEVLKSLAVNITTEINAKADANRGLMAGIVKEAVAAKLEEAEERRRQDGSIDVGIIGATGGTNTEGSDACTLCDGQLAVNDVLKLVRAELAIYDADKTGRVDYALESAGGSIVSVRCSQTYQLRTAQTSVFSIPLWYTYNSPRVIIQPGVHPGQCWAFTGTQGHVVVQLSRQIIVTEVSLEHIPKTLSPSGRIDSAPKDFGIWGLESESDTVGVPLGNFTYDDSGTPIQTFTLKRPNEASFRFVELKVNSNYGQESYTCLYRFRVHGYLDKSLA